MTCGGRSWKRHTLLSLLFCLSFTGCAQQEVINKEIELQAETTRDVTYELTQVYRGKVEAVEYIICTYKETEEVELSFEIDQELITEVYVEKGDSVKKGDLLASVNVDATKEKLEELYHQLALEELHFQQTIEKRDFELEQADIMFSYTYGTDKDKENLKEEKQAITDNYAKSIQNYEDTLYFQRKRIGEYEEYVAKGQLFAPMDGVLSWVKSDLLESLSEKDACIMRIYDPSSKLYYSDDIETIPYLEEGVEYTITCGLGKAQREYTVTPANMENWGELVYFRLLDEDYDPNNVVSGKITLVIDEKDDTLYVDNDVLHSSGDEYYVYMLDENNVRRMQFVEVGLWGAEVAEILSGLEEGDRVIVK